MAVFLCRSVDGVQAPPAELRNCPRLVVRSEPVTLGLDHRGKKINARSDTHYACAEPTREEVRKKNFIRRSTQLSECGFHGAPSSPYKDVGEVVLDDRRLIQEGIWQTSSEKEDHPRNDVDKGGTVTSGGWLQQQQQLPVCMSSPYRLRLRAKTPSQFPTELASLEEKLDGVEERLELVRKGRGLFKLMRDREKEKESEEELVILKEEEAKRSAWAEPDISSQVSLSNGTVSSEHNVLQKESSSVSLNLQAVQEKLTDEANESGATSQSSCDNKTIISQWYRQLCVLVWVLEAMRMESPSYMTPLSQCWKLDCPPPNEAKGKKRVDMLKTQLQKFDHITKQHKVKEKSKSSGGEAVKTEQSILACMRCGGSLRYTNHVTAKSLYIAGIGQSPRTMKSTVRLSHSEEERMKRQKKLSPGQMENLLMMLEEELNYSKKQSRSRINALMREAGQARTRGDEHLERRKKKTEWQLPPISLDVSIMERQFSETEEAKTMIVHEQLKAMERDHGKATQQRFGSLEVSGNIWQDLKMMRQGVEIETTAMARRRLLMNYEWFPELLSQLPDSVKNNHYCRKLLVHLAALADYMCDVGPWKMSKKKLSQVLATFRPWELYNPDIEAAVQFLTQHVIYIVAEDYGKWLECHTLAYKVQKSRTTVAPAKPHHVTF